MIGRNAHFPFFLKRVLQQETISWRSFFLVFISHLFIQSVHVLHMALYVLDTEIKQIFVPAIQKFSKSRIKETFKNT